MSRIPITACVLGAALLAALSRAQQTPGTLQSRGSHLRILEPDEEELDLRTTPVVRCVQKAADSVVSVYIQNRHHLAGGTPATEGQGSGVILDEGGFVITNWHVIAPVLLAEGYQAQVRHRDGSVRSAKVLSSAPAHDLALLQVELEPGEKLSPVAIGRSAGLMIGETVVAIGNPQGHANTVTSGVLSAIDRAIRVRAPDGVLREYTGLLQTDAAINQGNSGGALLDITGRLIGINNAMAVGAENIGFAIPVDTVREVFEGELLGSASFVSSAESAWFGLKVEEAEGRLVVADVWPESPAAAAGLRSGDTITRVGGAEVRSPMDYLRRILTAQPQEPLPMTVLRSGRHQEVAPTPETRLSWALATMTGVAVEEVSPGADPVLVQKATRAFYASSRSRQIPLLPVVLRVSRVDGNGPASALGLQKGDVILSVVGYDPRYRIERDQRLDSARDFASILAQRAGSTAKLVVLRGDDELVGTLDIRRAPAAQGYR